MQLTIVALLCVFLANGISFVYCACEAPSPDADAHITETTPSFPGYLYIIYSSDDYTFNATSKTNFSDSYNDYMRLRPISNGGHLMELTKVFDLDAQGGPRPNEGDSFVVNIEWTCTDRITRRQSKYYKKLYVKSMDDIPPRFAKNLTFSVREDAPPGVKLGTVSRCIDDIDWGAQGRTYNFTTDSRGGGTGDGFGVFNITRSGEIRLSRPVDYESGVHAFKLRVKGQYLNGTPAVTDVTIKVINVNDNPILIRGCNVTCYSIDFRLRLTSDTVGEVMSNVVAGDKDGDSIEYEIVSGSPPSYGLFLEIDRHTGNLFLIRPSLLPYLDLVIKTTSLSYLPDAKRLPQPLVEEMFAPLTIVFDDVKVKVPDSVFLSSGKLQSIFGLPGLLAVILLIHRWL